MTRMTLLSSLRIRLTLLLLAVLLPSAGVIATMVADRYEHDTEVATERLTTTVRQLAAKNGRLFGEGYEMLRAMAASPSVINSVDHADPGYCHDFLARIADGRPQYTTLAVIDLNGEVTCSGATQTLLPNMAGHSWYKRVVESRGFVVSDYIVGTTPGTAGPQIHLGYPVFGVDGAVIGVVAAALDIGWLNQSLAAMEVSDGVVLALVDMSGTLLARRPDPDLYVGRTIPEGAVRVVAANPDGGVLEVLALDGKHRLFAFAPFGGGDGNQLTLWAGQEHQALTARAWREARLGIIVLGIVGLAGLLAGPVVGQLVIVKPAGRVIQAARRLAAGDLSVRVGPVHGAGELGALARAFDAMADALEDRERLVLEREQAREHAHAAALRMAAILRSTTDGVIEVDRDWRFTFINDQASALLARGRDLTGMTLWEAFPGMADTAFGAAYRRAMEDRAPGLIEGFDPDLGGWLEVRIVPSENGLAFCLRNVTDRKRLEQDLARSRDLMARVMETLPVGVCVTGPQGELLDKNPAARRIWCGGAPTGIEPCVEPKGWWADTGQRVADADWPAARAVRQGATSLSQEIEIERPDGTRRIIRNSAAPIRAADGAVLGAVAVIEDVTEARQIERQRLDAEAQRAVEEAKYRAIFDTAVDAIAVIDETGTIQSFNQAAERMFGYAAAEVSGQNVELLMPPSDRERHKGYLEQHLHLGRSRVTGRMVNARRKDGSLFPLELAITEWQAEGRRFFTGVMRDLTERRQAEQAILEGERRLRIAMKAAGLGDYETDLNVETFIRSSFIDQLFGFEPGEAGRSTARFFARMHRDDIASVHADMQATIRERGELRHEFRVVLPDGTIRWLASRGEVVCGEDGNPERLVGVMMDITDLRRTTAALAQAKEEAERANLTKSKFLAAASHDLRQPVQSLFFFSSVLAARLPGDAHPAAEALRGVDRALSALKVLLDGLLDVSKLDAGMVQPETTDFPIGDLLERLEAEYQPRAAGKKLRLRVVGTSLWGHSDPALLTRILRNLIENALKFTERGGIVIGCRRRGRHIRIDVVDNGIGIPGDQIGPIFEEFHQVGNPERDREQGLGLGLAIVRRLVQLLGYRLQVNSRLGQGSRFSIEIPSAECAAMPEPEDLPPADHVTPGLIVLIDDETIVLMGLNAVIQEWGFQVIAGGSGEQVLAELDERPERSPDLIIADYRLRHGRTGVEAIQAIRDRFGAAIPGIVLTGDTDPERLREAEKQGFGMLHKPVPPNTLRAAMEQALIRPARAGASAPRAPAEVIAH